MKKKIIIYGVFVTLLFCLIVSSIYAFVALGKKPINDIENESTTIPSITEEFNAVTSKLLSKYDGVITYDEKSTEIYELTSSEKYILGSNGKLYPDKIKYINSNEESSDEILKFDRYEIRKNEDKNDNTLYYYHDKLNKKSSDSYSFITPVYYKNKNTPRYLLLTGDNIELLDIKTHKVITLNKEISWLPEFSNELYGYEVITNNKYEIVVKSNNDKYGIINSKGEILIDFVYDNIVSYKNGLFIAKMNDKYGIIDKNNKIVLNFDYDSMSTSGNYIIVTKGDKLGVLNNKYKVIVDYSITIDTSIDFYNIPNNDIHGTYSSTISSGSLLLMIYPKGYVLDEGGIYKKKDSTAKDIKAYVISSRGIDRTFTINSNIEPLYTDDNYENIGYYYSIFNTDGKVTVTFYDTDYYEYYKYTTKKLINSNYNVSVYMINNICYIEIYYDVNGNYETIYLDLINSREIKEIDALYKYFDNGYGYTLKDNVLKIYKNKEELEKFDNIKSYLGGYLFSTNDNSIIELEFHKEK